MKEISKKSVEILTHFQCIFCKKWWTVGDAPTNKEKWFVRGVEKQISNVKK